MTDRFSIEDVITILEKVPSPDEPILVGGQALNYWAEYYAVRDDTLREFAPFTSRDVDFLGGVEAAVALKEVWHGDICLPTMDDHTPQTAKVSFSLQDGRDVELDFLGVLMGLDEAVVRKNAVRIPLQTKGHTLSVMHPLHCLASRLHNVYGMLYRRSHPGGEHEVQRVQLAIKVLKHMITQTLHATPRKKGDYKLIETLAALALTQVANHAFYLDGVDILEAIPDSDNLGHDLLHRRLPRLQRQTAEKRARYIRAMEKAAAMKRVQAPVKNKL